MPTSRLRTLVHPGLLMPGLVLLFAALFLRSYTVPPAPDRRGGTAVSLAWPNRPFFGSPRADCLSFPADEPVIACLIGSVARARADGLPLMQFGFCGTCYALSQRIAGLGRDEAAIRARLDAIARFGW
ncbi:hypothetical protein [Methylobacterium sp. Leaf117]|uniref:hypothetical protein n=1 Tax=Methylobacterium sp. Leaf117 TaxID=1736260 RepID=UPI0006FA9281|nr:hypothetical protein [Methylobacterium sp. Leaf117]KQP96813.1 hypothetical protein ASF57_03620 [Methylobacterium sp. Leaf117]